MLVRMAGSAVRSPSAGSEAVFTPDLLRKRSCEVVEDPGFLNEFLKGF
jgi:hypothetical protein